MSQFRRLPLSALPRILASRGAKRLWLSDDNRKGHVLLPMDEYTELVAYKRQAKSWIELSLDEQAVLHAAAKAAKENKD